MSATDLKAAIDAAITNQTADDSVTANIVGTQMKAIIDFAADGDSEAYTLPPATEESLGGVKQGANVTIASDGTISVVAPGGGSSTDDVYINTDTEDVSTKSVVFIGDSITLGYYATAPANKFSSLIATGLGMVEDNQGVSGATALNYNLSLVPIKTNDLKYLCIILGVNDAYINQDNYTVAQFAIDYQTFLTAIIAKGWPVDDIYIFNINGFSTETTADRYQAFNTVITNIATANGTHFVDIYSTVQNLGFTQLKVAADTLHPGDLGHYLISVVALAQMNIAHFNVVGLGLTNGSPTQLTKLNLKNTGIMNYGRLLGVDSIGNVLISMGLPPDTRFNGIILNGSIINDESTPPTGFDLTKDIHLQSGATVYSYNAGVGFIRIFDATTGESVFSNSYGGHSFYVGNPASIRAVFIDQTGFLQALIGIKLPPAVKIKSNYQNNGGELEPFTEPGNTALRNFYSAGYLEFETSNTATDGTSKVMMTINPQGRVRVGNNTPYTDIPTARFAIDSITEGFLKPRLTSTQRDAIVSPVAGLEIYNTTTNTMNFYNGTAWRQITDVAA